MKLKQLLKEFIEEATGAASVGGFYGGGLSGYYNGNSKKKGVNRISEDLEEEIEESKKSQEKGYVKQHLKYLKRNSVNKKDYPVKEEKCSKKVKKLAHKLEAEGKPEDSAWAIAKAKLENIVKEGTEYDTSSLENFANKTVGNWKKWNTFHWYEKPDANPENWAMFYTKNRDSGLIDQTNAEVIAKEMSAFPEDQVQEESHNHWAVGYVDGYAIKVYDDNGQITDAFKKMYEIQKKLENYPLLDDDLYSEKEHESALEAIEQEGKNLVKQPPPEDWESEVYVWLSENEPNEVENKDDQGAYPSKESIKNALYNLDMLDDSVTEGDLQDTLDDWYEGLKGAHHQDLKKEFEQYIKGQTRIEDIVKKIKQEYDELEDIDDHALESYLEKHL